MTHRDRIIAVIPARNEEKSIALVLADLPADLIDLVVVADNGSSDRTAEKAINAGAIVVYESTPGYGSACLAGIAEAMRHDPSIILFLDADYSDHPEEARIILASLLAGEADLVIGSRALGEREDGAMPPVARFGNWLSTRLIWMIWKTEFTDLGPFRAITVPALLSLEMSDPNFGWTVEMQAKAAQMGLRTREVPVSYRRRIGRSKISGTISGSVRAGWKILWTIARLALARRKRVHLQ